MLPFKRTRTLLRINRLGGKQDAQPGIPTETGHPQIGITARNADLARTVTTIGSRRFIDAVEHATASLKHIYVGRLIERKGKRHHLSRLKRLDFWLRRIVAALIGGEDQWLRQRELAATIGRRGDAS